MGNSDGGSVWCKYHGLCRCVWIAEKQEQQHMNPCLLYTCVDLSLSNAHRYIYLLKQVPELMKHNRASMKLWLPTAELFQCHRPHDEVGTSSRKWDTALESWNMSKRLGEILLNTASWHLLLSALTGKCLPRLTCIFVTPAWPLLAASLMMAVERRCRGSLAGAAG